MKIYEFTGDRGDFQGRTLAKGDRLDLTPEDAEYLIVGQDFPIKELPEETKEEVKEDGTV